MHIKELFIIIQFPKWYIYNMELLFALILLTFNTYWNYWKAYVTIFQYHHLRDIHNYEPQFCKFVISVRNRFYLLRVFIDYFVDSLQNKQSIAGTMTFN